MYGGWIDNFYNARQKAKIECESQEMPMIVKEENAKRLRKEQHGEIVGEYGLWSSNKCVGKSFQQCIANAQILTRTWFEEDSNLLRK